MRVVPELAAGVDAEHVRLAVAAPVGDALQVGAGGGARPVLAQRGGTGGVTGARLHGVGYLAAEEAAAVHHVPVQVRAGHVAGRARAGDPLALPHPGPGPDADGAEVGVLGAPVVAVVDQDLVAAAPVGPAGVVHRAASRGDDGGARAHGEVDGVAVVVVVVRVAAARGLGHGVPLARRVRQFERRPRREAGDRAGCRAGDGPHLWSGGTRRAARRSRVRGSGGRRRGEEGENEAESGPDAVPHERLPGRWEGGARHGCAVTPLRVNKMWTSGVRQTMRQRRESRQRSRGPIRPGLGATRR